MSLPLYICTYVLERKKANVRFRLSQCLTSFDYFYYRSNVYTESLKYSGHLISQMSFFNSTFKSRSEAVFAVSHVVLILSQHDTLIRRPFRHRIGHLCPGMSIMNFPLSSMSYGARRIDRTQAKWKPIACIVRQMKSALKIARNYVKEIRAALSDASESTRARVRRRTKSRD